MRVDDRKRHLTEEDAALKLRYGELHLKATVRVSRRELTEKILAILAGSAGSSSRIFPWTVPHDLTGIGREKVVNIDHFRKEKPNFHGKAGKFPMRAL